MWLQPLYSTSLLLSPPILNWIQWWNLANVFNPSNFLGVSTSKTKMFVNRRKSTLKGYNNIHNLNSKRCPPVICVNWIRHGLWNNNVVDWFMHIVLIQNFWINQNMRSINAFTNTIFFNACKTAVSWLHNDAVCLYLLDRFSSLFRVEFHDLVNFIYFLRN